LQEFVKLKIRLIYGWASEMWLETNAAEAKQ